MNSTIAEVRELAELSAEIAADTGDDFRRRLTEQLEKAEDEELQAIIDEHVARWTSIADRLNQIADRIDPDLHRHAVEADVVVEEQQHQPVAH
jgi:division protein CdvB (Snf7/Vps24/ESCRT-III family)